MKNTVKEKWHCHLNYLKYIIVYIYNFCQVCKCACVEIYMYVVVGEMWYYKEYNSYL